MNTRLRTLYLIVCGLLLAAMACRNGDVALLTIPFFLYLATGLGMTPTAEDVRLRASRSWKRIGEKDSLAFEIVVNVWNEGEKTVNVLLSDPLLTGMTIVDGSLVWRAVLAPGDETALRYTFTTARGYFVWESVRVVVGDPFDLFVTELKIEAKLVLVVKPKFNRLRHIPLRAWKTLTSPGCVPTRLGGSGTDFWGLREYRPGDDLKNLDWRRTGRRPYSFVTKEFVLEKTADIVLILDGRGEMDFHAAGRSLFEIGTQTMAALAELFLHQGQRLSLFVCGGSVTKVLPDYGRVQLRRVMKYLAAVVPGSVVRSVHSAGFADIQVKKLPRNALTIVMSPIAPDDLSFFQYLRAFGHQTILISPDVPDFISQATSGDWADAQARRAYRIERRLALGRIARLSVAVIDLNVNRALEPQINAAFARPIGVRRV